MLKTRVIPCLLIQGSKLVKTVKFASPQYIGDAVNAIKIYNEKEVDELVCLDISATIEGREPSFDTISRIANECFMPLAYGGGVNSIEHMQKIFSLGVEKIIINSCALKNPDFIAEAAKRFGRQSIIISIDVKQNIFRKYSVYASGGKVNTGIDPVEWAKKASSLGAGEILLTSIDRDGTWKGYDTELIRMVSSAVSVPVIASGGAGEIEHFVEAVKAGASAVAAGSMVVYQKKDLGVLINFPSREKLESALP